MATGILSTYAVPVTACLALAALTGPITADARPMTSTEQARFSKSFAEACRQGPHIQAMIRDHGGDVAELRAYCDCAGDYFARHLSAEEWKSGADPTSTRQNRLHAAAFRTCTRQIFGL